MLAMYQAVAEKYGYAASVISATPEQYAEGNDRKGLLISPVEPAVKLIGDSIEYAMNTLPIRTP